MLLGAWLVQRKAEPTASTTRPSVHESAPTVDTIQHDSTKHI